MITKLAVKWLTYRLKKDPSFWIAYQANIAMAFYDVVMKELNEVKESDQNYKLSNHLLRLSNEAADNFMNLWTGKRFDEKGIK